MKKRALSFLMCLAMIFSLMPINALATDEHTHDREESVAVVEEVAVNEAVCTCESDDPEMHAPFCALYVAPESPVCTCVEHCTADTVNEWCDVCCGLCSLRGRV